jgi:hypothetical protein
MQFKHSGHIEIPEARKRLWLRKYPEDEEGLRARADGKLPERYYEASRHLHEVEPQFLAALIAGELKAFVLDGQGNKLEVPADYWECDGARVVTLERGELETTSSSRRDWREFNGRPCFLDEQQYAAWLSNGTSPVGGTGGDSTTDGSGVAAQVASEDAKKLGPRERAKAETAKRHQAWNERAIVVRMEYPKMLHSWIATKVAKEVGADPLTVRRVIMTKLELNNAARERQAAQAPSAR